MKKSTLLVLLITTILSSSSLLSAQDSGGSNQALLESTSNFYMTYNIKDTKAVGSPYLNKAFLPAHISAMPDKVFKVRYNAYDDEIEIEIDEGNIQNFNKNIKGVVVTMLNDDLKFTSISYVDDINGLTRGYLTPLTENNKKVKLFSRKAIKLIEAKPAVTSYDKDKPAEFKVIGDTPYISVNDAYARELPKNKKDIAKLFPENSKDVLNFIKKNKIKTSREADLIKLINYLNTL